MLRVAQAAGIENVCAHPQFLGGFPAMASASPVTILIFTPICSRGRDGCLGVVPRRIEQRQHAKKLPFAVALGPRHAQRAKAARREFVDRLVDGGLHLAGIGRQRQDHLRRALRHLELLSVRALDGGLGALMHRVERLEMDHLVALQGLIVFQAAQNGQIDGVVIVRARRQRGVEDHLLGGDIVHAERIAQCQLVLGQGAGLVRAQHVHARQFLDGHQAGSRSPLSWRAGARRPPSSPTAPSASPRESRPRSAPGRTATW